MERSIKCLEFKRQWREVENDFGFNRRVDGKKYKCLEFKRQWKKV